jgi:hypothetical protein
MDLTKLAMLDELAKIRPDLYVLLTRAALAEAAGASTDFDALMQAGFETLLERLESEPDDRDVLQARFDLEDFAKPYVFGVTKSLRSAVEAAIRAYEKSGKMLDAALAYAAHGFPVFPLSVKNKRPIPKRDPDPTGR